MCAVSPGDHQKQRERPAGQHRSADLAQKSHNGTPSAASKSHCLITLLSKTPKEEKNPSQKTLRCKSGILQNSGHKNNNKSAGKCEGTALCMCQQSVKNCGGSTRAHLWGCGSDPQNFSSAFPAHYNSLDSRIFMCIMKSFPPANILIASRFLFQAG